MSTAYTMTFTAVLSAGSRGNEATDIIVRADTLEAGRKLAEETAYELFGSSVVQLITVPRQVVVSASRASALPASLADLDLPRIPEGMTWNIGPDREMVKVHLAYDDGRVGFFDRVPWNRAAILATALKYARKAWETARLPEV
ncbi:hypothetical protein RS84_00009 [Microbacterium hydrocarbonoxydans]|uniref:Uncharacterized protein n=1 Tax=Microbacterium hydrocarbonoxydans TaxID=273678 RepID=A0A0M2HX81_9MICO|nr:hypothetical protein [Microbacterium hydrocarbonoxydans]KJL49535.1 hypothetical protein RS84_00009 [Microbacterium hydrocarbonoxydans]